MSDPEVTAVQMISEALGSLEDLEARRRVLQWATGKFTPQTGLGSTAGVSSAETRRVPAGQSPPDKSGRQPMDLSEIVEQSDDGNLQVIARDLKARSRNDAAIRLAHIAVYAHQALTSETRTSAKKILLPILRAWRAYDPNTRVALAHQPGIMRDKDWLSLDVHAKRDAEKYIREVLDDSIEGSWRPTNQAGKKKAKKTESAKTGK